MPLMLFSEDFIYNGNSANTGCAFANSVCNSGLINKGETWGVVDLTFPWYETEEQRAETAARTLAHELGHMVSIKATSEMVPDL